MIKAQTGNLTL